MPKNAQTPEKSPDQLLRLFVDTVKEYAILMMDTEGRIIHLNEGATHILGYQLADVAGRHLNEIFTAEDNAAGAPERELSTALHIGSAADERWHVRKDGSRFWALGIVRPICDEQGTLLGFGKILRDRTDLKELQQTLELRNEALEQVDEQRKLFLATLAHELRNPQAVLANSVALLRHHAKGNVQVERMADVIGRQVSHATRLIDDLADVARASQGKMHLDRHVLDLRVAASEAAEAVRPDAQSRNQTFNVLLSQSPVQVNADADRIRQILTNLLGNAIRYTDPGGRIGLTVDLEGHEAVIRVLDNGAGIPPDQLAWIFELFTQAHEGRSEAQAGLGIGLALTRELVTSHGGTIQARSDGPGKGSEFVVRLPAHDVGRQTPAG